MFEINEIEVVNLSSVGSATKRVTLYYGEGKSLFIQKISLRSAPKQIDRLVN